MPRTPIDAKREENFNILYIKSCTDGKTVGLSNIIEIPSDYFESVSQEESNKNYNIKVGNLFYNHSKLNMKRLTIFRNSFFDDLKNIEYIENTKISKYSYLEKMISKIIIDDNSGTNKNPYNLVRDTVKSTILNEDNQKI